MHELVKGTNPNYVLGDRSYGKSDVRILHVVKDGLVHNVKELEVSTRLTLSTEKDYLHGDNSDIIATDSQKNTVYVLAKKFGVKSPEDFAILLCNHFLSKYNHVMKVVITVEERLWNRISYGEGSSQMFHNHAFIHTPICTRSTNVTWKRNGKNCLVIASDLAYIRFLRRILSDCHQRDQRSSRLENNRELFC